MSVEAHSAMRLGLQLTIRQTNVPQSGYPLTVNVSPMQAESFHGSHARVKTFLEMLAAFLQMPESFSRPLQHSCKRQKVFRGLCSVPANSRKFFEALAASLQRPKSFSGHLQRRCKRQKVFRGLCSIPANAKKFFAALAAFLQRPKSFSEHLQHSSRGQKVFRGICSIPAKTKKFFAAFAAFLRTPKGFSRLLRSSRKHFPQAMEARGFRGCSLLAFFLHRTPQLSSSLSPMRLTSAN